MPDLDPNSTMQTFSFTMNLKVGGIVDSDTTFEETKEKLQERLQELYGLSLTIEDFHVASEEEILEYMSAIAEDATAGNETIN